MPRVSEERRAALRKFCELAERGQSTLGRVAVGTGDILGVLDDLEVAESTALALRLALVRTHSRLSLIRHRGGLRWDVAGELGSIGTEWECDEILGLAEAALAASRGGSGAPAVLWGPPSPDPTHPGRFIRFGMANGANVPDEGAGG